VSEGCLTVYFYSGDGNGLQYTFNGRDNRALGRLHWDMVLALFGVWVWGLGLGFGFGVWVYYHHHYDFHDIRYPAETGCFGTLGELGMEMGPGIWSLEGRSAVFSSSDLSFWRDGVYSTMRCLLMDTKIPSLSQ